MNTPNDTYSLYLKWLKFFKDNSKSFEVKINFGYSGRKKDRYGDYDDVSGEITYTAVRPNSTLSNKERKILSFLNAVNSNNSIGYARNIERGMYSLTSKTGSFEISRGESGYCNEIRDLRPDSYRDGLQIALELIQIYAASFDDEMSVVAKNLLYDKNPMMTFWDLKKSKIYDLKRDKFSFYIGKFDRRDVFVKAAALTTIAPPGAGKTQCHVIPNLRNFAGGAIVLDIKGECLAHTSKWREKHVGPVKVLNFENPEKSVRFNPFSLVSQDTKKVWSDAKLLSSLLVVPESKSDPTWEKQGQNLLTFILAFVAFLPEPDRNMSTVLDMVSEIGLQEALELVASSDREAFTEEMYRAAHKILALQQRNDKQYQGVLTGAEQHLSVWEGADLKRLTSGTDWAPEEFRELRPLTLYICISQENVKNLAPILRVIVAQHLQQFLAAVAEARHMPVLLMLDEFPQLGYMEPIRKAIELGRGYGIKLWMIGQFIAQFRDAYGRSMADGMISSCTAQLYMNPDADVAERLSRVVGKRKNLVTDESEPALSVQDLLGPECRDEVLVVGRSEKTMRLQKDFYHERKQHNSQNR